jgi:S1-C subfamily serine protease
LRPGGLIVTADEALAEEGDVTVTLPSGHSGGQILPASEVGRDPSTDIALLRIDQTAPLPAQEYAAMPVAGALAMIVGAHEGVPMASLGVVALADTAWQSVRGGEIDARIELDVAMRRSAEGGMVIGAAGAWLGMAVFGPRRRVLVIPTVTIARVSDRLATHGRIGRGYFGLALQPVETDAHQASGQESGIGMGAMVMSVDANGPAAAAGIRQGDVIVSWNEQPVSGLRQLLRGLGPESVGRELALGVRRAGDAIEIRLTIGERLAN